MKISRIKIGLTTVGLLIVCTLGGFALSLAHDRLPADSTYAPNLHRDLPNGVSELTGKIRQIRFDCATGDVPPSLQEPLPAACVVHARPTATDQLAMPRCHYGSKIARHMLHSILLI